MLILKKFLFAATAIAMLGAFAVAKPANAAPFAMSAQSDSSFGDHGMTGWYHHHYHHHHHHYSHSSINIHL